MKNSIQTTPPEQALNKIYGVYDRLLAQGHISDVMPTWDEDKRALTNSIARSAVFSAVERHNKTQFSEYRVPAPSNYEIFLTGEQLNEADRDVYLQAIHYFRGCVPNQEIRISPRDFLLAIGRQDGLEGRRWLWGSIKRIAKTVLEISILFSERKIKFVGALFTIVSEEKNGVPGEIRMRLPLDALRLYNEDSRTLLSMSRRLSLKGPGSQLAKSLQAKIYSHKNPFPMRLETLMEQCGSKRYKRITDFKKNLILALKLLLENEDIEGFSISKDGLVTIRRKGMREK